VAGALEEEDEDGGGGGARVEECCEGLAGVVLSLEANLRALESVGLV